MTKEIEQEVELARLAIRFPKGALTGGPPAPGAPAWQPEAEEAALQNQTYSFATIGDHDIIAAVPGMKILVYELLVWNVAEQNLEFKDGADSLSGPWPSFPEKSGVLLPSIGEPRWQLTTGRPFRLTTSGATRVSGYVLYIMST